MKLEFTLPARFWSKVDKSGDCWLWTGARECHGYGSIGVGSRSDGTRRTRLAHHIAYELEHGEIPANQCVLHRCDNPSCVRPEHLFLGTQQDNVADMVSKGRQNLGARNGNAMLNDEIVATIRSRLAKGESRAAIARSIGISRSAVSLIGSGKRWRHASNV